MAPKRQLIDVVPFAEQLTSIINENRQRFKNIPAMQEVIDLLEMAKGYALNQPIVDAVEVVRCKDCTRRKKGYCTIRKDSWGATLLVGDHDFCSDAERSEET